MQQTPTDRSRSRVGSLVVLAASAIVVWAAVVLTVWPSHGRTFNWDEVDYAVAAEAGVLGNALERGSLSATEFYRFAKSKQGGGEPVLPVGYDEARDPFLLRHFHPPLVVYLTSVVSAFGGARDERVLRSGQLLGALALVIFMLAAYRGLSQPPTWAGLLIVSILTYWLSLILFSSLSMHGWMAVWIVAASALTARWLGGRERWAGVLLCVCMALSLLTLETGLANLLGVVISLALWGRRSPELRGRALWKDVAIGACITALVVVALWPGVVFKISMAKTFAMHAYRIRLGDEYAVVGEKAGKIFSVLYAPTLLALAAGALLFATVRADIRRWGAFLIIGSVNLLLLVKFAISPSYLAPGLAPFACLAGYACDRLSSPRARVLVAAVALLTVAASPLFWLPPSGDDPAMRNVEWFKEKLRGREALVDGANIYGYYLGDAYSVRPALISYDGKTLYVRRDGRYEAVGADEVTGKVVVLLSRTAKLYPLEQDILRGCSREDGESVRLYDCGAGGE